MSRIAKLAQNVWDADAAGRTWELTFVAGRRALRVRREDGIETSFLDAAEEAELTALIASGPPALALPGLPVCTWNGWRNVFVGVEPSAGKPAVDPAGIEVVVDAPLREPDRDTDALARAARAYQRVRARLDAIRVEVATHLEASARTWGAKGEVARRFRVTAIHLSGAPQYADRAHAYLTDGGVFNGHTVEVWLDADATVTDAAIAG